MPGGGGKYEAFEREPPRPEELLVEGRKERIEEVVALRTRSLVVVLDKLEDTFNMAAVLRTCEAMGLQEVHVIENPDERFRPNLKVTQGCDKWLDIFKYKDAAACFEALRSRGFEVWVSAIREGASNVFDLRFDKKMALVFGNERRGVSQEVLDAADGVFWIPMRGFVQSLNISAAVSASVTHAIGWRHANGQQAGDLSPAETEALKAQFAHLSVKQRAKIYKDGVGG